jgi:hypothetical protein
MEFGDQWLSEKLSESFEKARATIMKQALLRIGDHEVSLDKIAYECEELDHLIDERDLAVLTKNKVGLPRKYRDKADRWRKVIHLFPDVTEIGVEDAFALFEDDGNCSSKPKQWYVRFLAAAIEASVIAPIYNYDCLLLKSGRRAKSARADR